MIVVIFYHARFTFFPGGFLAVSIFFTMSGFLITSLLLREWASDRAIDMRSFWSRRFRRLLPAAWVTLGGVVVLGALGAWDGDQLTSLRGDVPFSLLQVVNWHFILQNHTYGGSFTAPTPVEHYWSLSVEEQFYLIIPLLVLAVLSFTRSGTFRTRVRRVAAVLTVLLVASAVLNGLLARNSIDRAYFGTDTRMAEMLAGALLACFTVRRLRLPDGRTKQLVRPLGFIGLVAIVALWRFGSLRVQWMYPWGLLLTAAATCAVIIGTVQGGVAERILAFKPIAQLGRMSYGTYLVHWPIFLVLTPARTGLDAAPLFAVRFFVSVAVSTLLFFYIEEPIRRRRKLTGPGFVLTGAVFLPILLITSFLVTNGAEPTSVIQRDPTGSAATTGSASRAPRILFLGDQTVRWLADVIDGDGSGGSKSSPLDASASAVDDCGLIIGGWIVREDGGAEQDVNRCRDAVSTWADAITTSHPDLVVVVPSRRDAAARLASESGAWELPAIGQGSNYRSVEMGSTLDTLIAAADAVGSPIVAASAPMIESDPPSEAPPRPVIADEFREEMRQSLETRIRDAAPDPLDLPPLVERLDIVNTILEDVARSRNVDYVDLAAELRTLLPDGDHLDIREPLPEGSDHAITDLRDWFLELETEHHGTLVEAPPPPASLTDIQVPDAPPVTPRLRTAPDQDVSVLVVGDSIAYALGYGLVDWAEGERAHVAVAAQFGCPVARGGRYRMQRDSQPFADGCDWSSDYPRFVDEMRPEVVVLSSTMWQVVDRQLPGDTTYRHMGDEVLDRYVLSEFLSAVDALGSGGATVTLLTGAYVESGREKGFSGLPESEHARMDRLNEIIRQVVDLRPDTTKLIDLQAFLRTQDGGELSPESRPDGIHFTDEMARRIADWLGPQIESIARGDAPHD